MQPTWAVDFPRLYGIFCEGGRDNTLNYFQTFDEDLKNPLARPKYERLEEDLQQLDDSAWRELRQKIVKFKYVAIRDELRGYHQLFDILLSEAKGYLYLKSEGCTDVCFIPEARTKTPDLYGRCGSSGILMEVKTINESKEELGYRKANSELRNGRRCMKAREFRNGLGDGLKSKIGYEIKEGKEKFLNYPCDGVQRRIVFLVVYPDLELVLGSGGIDDLVAFIQEQDREEQHNSQVEVKYCFGGW